MFKFIPYLFACLAALALPLTAATTQIHSEANGYQIGTTPAQAVGFHGATPVAQRANASQGYAGAAVGTLTFSGNPAALDTATIGTVAYTFTTSGLSAANQIVIGGTADGTLANTIAAVNAAAGSGSTYGSATVANPSAFASAGALVAASSTLTSNNTAPSDGDTVTIGTKVYTFKTTLTPTEGQVLINTTADAALLNLIRAINHSGTPGTDYQCAAADPTVSAATSVTSHHFLITALVAGASGNTIATTVTGATISFTGSTLASGTSAITLTATAAGTAGNSVATTETSSSLSFGGTTLAGGTAAPSNTQLAVLLNELRDQQIEKGLIKGRP